VPTDAVLQEERAKLEEEKKKLQEMAQSEREQREKLEALIGSLEHQVVTGQSDEKALLDMKSKMKRQKQMTKRMKEEKEAAEEAALMADRQHKTLQDELAEKTQVIRKLRTRYKQMKSEVTDLQREFEDEREAYQETIREQSRQLKLHIQIVQHILSAGDLKKIVAQARFDEDRDKWALPQFSLTQRRIQLPDLVHHAYRQRKAEESDESSASEGPVVIVPPASAPTPPPPTGAYLMRTAHPADQQIPGRRSRTDSRSVSPSPRVPEDGGIIEPVSLSVWPPKLTSTHTSYGRASDESTSDRPLSQGGRPRGEGRRKHQISRNVRLEPLPPRASQTSDDELKSMVEPQSSSDGGHDAPAKETPDFSMKSFGLGPAPKEASSVTDFPSVSGVVSSNMPLGVPRKTE